MSRLFQKALWRVAAAAAVAALGAFGAPAAAAPAAPRSAAAPAAPGADAAAAVTIAASNGIAATHGDTSLTALIRNTRAVVLPAGEISFWRADRLGDRTAVSRWEAGTDAPAALSLGRAPVPELGPGESATVAVQVPHADLGPAVSTPTVYGIGATLRISGAAAARSHGMLLVRPDADDTADDDGTHDTAGTQGTVGTQGNAGTRPAGRPRLAVAVPVTAPPSSDGVISATVLARLTAPDGLLTRQLDELRGQPQVAVGIDPRIIASIRVLGASAPASATQWQERLLRLPNEVFPLQYGDADAAVQVQAGVRKLLAPTSFDWATGPADVHDTQGALGETATPDGPTPGRPPGPTPSRTPPALPDTAQILAWPYSASGIVWPPEGTVSARDAAEFAKNDLTTVIAGSGNVSGWNPDAPRAAFQTAGTHVLVSDSMLSDALRQAVTADTDTGWNAAMAKLNAQLATLPGARTTVFATLERGWADGAAQLAHTLRALDRDEGATLVSVPDVLGAPHAAGLALRKEAESPTRVDRVRALLEMEKRIDAFSSALVQPRVLSGRVRARMLSLLGVGWLGPDHDWSGGVEEWITRGAATLSAVSIVPSSPINVASTEAPLPVTVENKLDHPVALILVAEPSNPRLEIDASAHKTIPADARGTVLVPVKARLGNGRVDLNLQLYSATGTPIGPAAMIPVDVHAQWEGVAATAVAGLIVGLFGFGVARNIRRHVRARRGDGKRAGTKAGTDG